MGSLRIKGNKITNNSVLQKSTTLKTTVDQSAHYQRMNIMLLQVRLDLIVWFSFKNSDVSQCPAMSHSHLTLQTWRQKVCRVSSETDIFLCGEESVGYWDHRASLTAKLPDVHHQSYTLWFVSCASCSGVLINVEFRRGQMQAKRVVSYFEM